MQDGSLDDAPIFTDLAAFDGKPWRGIVDTIIAGIPCFAAGTLVLSEDGYRPIESLAIGDRVLTHKGRWRAITSIMSRDDAALRRIHAQGVPGIVTTDEHPFYCRASWETWDNDKRRYVRQFGDPEWTDAERIAPGGHGHYLSQVLPPEDAAFEPKEAFWWVIGRYLADGWRATRSKRKSVGRGIKNRPLSNAKRGKVIICCNKKEEEALKTKIEEAGFHPIRVEDRTAIKFHISCVWLWKYLEPFGQYAHGKLLPGFVFTLPKLLARALLEGYFSGDGYWHKTGRRATTVSKALALSVALLAQRAYGVVASIGFNKMRPRTIIEGREVNQRDFYTVGITDRNRSAFVDGEYGWKLARKNEPCGRGRVFNISVEEDESYIADGAIVHNCQGNSLAGQRKLESDHRNLWPDTRRIIREVGPRYFFLENVYGLLVPGIGQPAPIVRILGELAEDGYDAEWIVVSAGEVGASQRRERVFLLAHRTRRLRQRNSGRLPAAEAGIGRTRELDGDRAERSVADGSAVELAGCEERGCGIVREPSGSDGQPDGERWPVVQSGSGKRRKRQPGARTDRGTVAGGAGGAMGDADGARCEATRSGPDDGTERNRERMLGARCVGVGVGVGVGLQGEQRAGAEARPTRPERGTLGAFPPGPGFGLDRVAEDVLADLEAGQTGSDDRFLAELAQWALWQRILEVRPDLAPAISEDEEAAIERKICLLADGIPARLGISRADQLRAYGNGVVELQAATAFRILMERLSE